MNKRILAYRLATLCFTVLALGLGLYLLRLKANNAFVSYAILCLLALWWALRILLPVGLMKRIILLIVTMFAFAFMLVPLYNVFCNLTGLNGKVDLSVARAASDIPIDYSRQVVIEFDVNYNQHMPWQFRPQHKSLQVYPGQIARTAYYAYNPTKRSMEGQAIPSISPAEASKYFKKIECFCFNSQKLGAKERAHFAIQFFIDPSLPKEIKRITLAYTLFDITKS
jgi:cytochrome c oxidase assembly protein subunit 11